MLLIFRKSKNKKIPMNKEKVEFIGQTEKEKRFKNICSLINKKYHIQENNNCKNIIIPSNSKKKIVLTAHYDVFRGSKGYNDNAAGIVSILNVIEKLPENVETVFTDNEEIGGIGSALYIENNKKNILWNLNIDVIGTGENIFYDVRDTKNIIKLPFTKKNYLNIPFNDSHIFSSYGIPAIILVSGETSSVHDIISEIWSCQHGNKYDNKMEKISEKAISNMSEFILKMVS